MISLFLNGMQVNLNGMLGTSGQVYCSDFTVTHAREGRELHFTERISEHTPTFPKRGRVELYDTVTPTGSIAAPGVRRFFGYIGTPEPSGHQVRYVAKDPLHRLHEILCHDSNSVPRLVLNVRVDDFDFPDSIANAYRPNFPMFHLSEIWRLLLELHDADVHAACPGLPPSPPWTKTPTGDVADFLVSGALHEDVSFDPERVIFEEQTLGDVFRQLLQLSPAWELHFDPETLLFRWLLRVNIGGTSPMPAATRTLNKTDDPSAAYQRPVVSKQIGESGDDRWTRVEILGPTEHVPRVAYKSTGDLVEDWDPTLEAGWSIFAARDNPNKTSADGQWSVFRQYKINDPTKRRMARWSRQGIWAPGMPGIIYNPSAFPDQRSIDYHVATFFSPHRPLLAAKFTYKSRAAWFAVPARFDYLNGIAVATNPLVLGDIRDPATTFQKADDILLAYAYLSAPLLASYPTTPATFSGTAYTLLGLQQTMRFYEEDFFDQTAQKTNYEKLAKSLWRVRSDVIFTGSCVAHGIDYSFDGFNSARNENFGRINFAGVNDSAVAVTTGWEAIDAAVHEIEYDYSSGSTTISFNSDWADYVFGDFQSLKLRVKEAYERYRTLHGLVWEELGGGPGFQEGIDRELTSIRIDFGPNPFEPGF